MKKLLNSQIKNKYGSIEDFYEKVLNISKSSYYYKCKTESFTLREVVIICNTLNISLEDILPENKEVIVTHPKIEKIAKQVKPKKKTQQDLIREQYLKARQTK